MVSLNHLRKALEHLREAEEEADLGTRLMIRPLRQQLETLINRTERNEDD